MSKVVFEITGMRYHVECYDRGRWVLVGLRSWRDPAIEAATEGCERSGNPHRVVDTWEDDNE